MLMTNPTSDQRLTFRFRNFSVSKLLPIFEGFGFGKFGLEKKVSVSVLKKLVLEKSMGFSFGKFGFRKKVSVLEKFGLGKKSRFRKVWSRKKSFGFRKDWIINSIAPSFDNFHPTFDNQKTKYWVKNS